MTSEEKRVNQVIEFLHECEQYLHSWCCTRAGEYQPFDIQGVRKALMNIVANGSKKPIIDFKKGVEDGTIILRIFTLGLPLETKRLLYENHCKNVKNFEKKYKIK